jgi:hypothetical protein
MMTSSSVYVLFIDDGGYLKTAPSFDETSEFALSVALAAVVE